MYDGPLRLVRTLTVSATCLALSLAAHVAGGGAAHSPALTPLALGGLGVVTIVLTLVTGAASARQWTLGRALVALGVGQAVLHVAFTLLLGSHQMTDVSAGPGLAMTLAHGVAALLVGTALASADRSLAAFCTLGDALARATGALSPWRYLALLTTAPADPATRQPQCGEGGHRPRIPADLVVLQCLSRRGPPVGAFAH